MSRAYKVPKYALPSIIDEFFKNFTDSLWDKTKFLNECELLSFPKYPPCNVWIKENGDLFCEIGVSGFNEDELGIEVIEEKLYIKGNKSLKIDSESRSYIIQDLAQRDFKMELPLSSKFDFNRINCKLKNGILLCKIPLREEIKESKKPRKIIINK